MITELFERLRITFTVVGLVFCSGVITALLAWLLFRRRLGMPMRTHKTVRVKSYDTESVRQHLQDLLNREQNEDRHQHDEHWPRISIGQRISLKRGD